jgi:hypothetical protein
MERIGDEPSVQNRLRARAQREENRADERAINSSGNMIANNYPATDQQHILAYLLDMCKKLEEYVPLDSSRMHDFKLILRQGARSDT